MGEGDFRMGGTSMAVPVGSPDQGEWLLKKYTRPCLGQPPGIADGGAILRHLEAGLPVGTANGGIRPTPLLDSSDQIGTGSLTWQNVTWQNSLDG